MKLWIDDIIPAPERYLWARSVNDAKYQIEWLERFVTKYDDLELIDIDHNAGDFVWDGGHYIKLLEWLEETGRNYPIHIHGDSEINKVMMRTIIERNGWKEIR